MTTLSSKSKPDWAGGDWLSSIVNALIQFKPLYGVMKQQARQVLIKTAERKGVPWKETVQQLNQIDFSPTFEQFKGSGQSYPDYYQVPFHAYAEGNLNWLAAFEAEPATYAMALRVWPQESLSWEVAQDRLRGSFHQVLDPYLPPVVRQYLDVGCSVGISTRYLHRFLQHRQSQAGVEPQGVGLDLSPYMLSVAQYRNDSPAIAWQQGLAEDTPFETNQFDLVTLQFILHELPQGASQDIFKEMLRILRPGGILAITDNNPKSPVIQNLPPVLFTLMKSTEPWSDEYYTFEVESALTHLGFEYVTTQASDPRHRTIIARKPTPTAV